MDRETDMVPPLSIGGWPALSRWALGPGTQFADPALLVDGLVAAVRADGIGEARLPAELTLTLRSANPLLMTSEVRWTLARNGAEERLSLGLDDMMPGATAATDIHRTVTRRIPLADGSVQVLRLACDADGAGAATLDPLADAMAAALLGPLEALIGRRALVTLAETYLGRRSARKVLEGAITRGHRERIEAVLWVSDLRGFTALSERLPPDRVVALLNAYFERQAAPIRAFGGEVLKFIGDGLLAIFPIEDGDADQAMRQAVRAARSALGSVTAYRQKAEAAGEPAPAIGIALHLGPVDYGNIGAPDRLDFTAIGATVNLASRLEGLCKPLGIPLILSAAAAAHAGEPIAVLADQRVPGIAEPIRIMTLADFAPKS
ncbi:MAG: adenylate/guanylate cyclase domain-containing protein [Azospirillaceae bacterium]